MSIDIAPGYLLAEKYRIVRLIGQGGMGSVWAAEHASLGKQVAVKFIDGPSLNAESTARFENEARAAARLDSRYVATVYDHGIADGRPYIVMELLRGEPLSDRIERLGKISPADTAALFSKIARALAKAHELGIVHRDLKPENVFLHTSDEEEIPKIVDFGIAKLGGGEYGVSSATRTGALLGTPYYMSPEQARGLKSLDFRTDLWSLAVIAYQCLVGKPPFDGDTLGDLFVKICTDDPTPPTLRDPSLPPALDAWMTRALMRDPAHRFATATELASTLAQALGVGVADRGSLVAIPPPVASAAAPPAIAATTNPTYGANAGYARTNAEVGPAAPKRGAPIVAIIAVVAIVAVIGGGVFVVTRPAAPTVAARSDAPELVASVAASTTPAASASAPSPTPSATADPVVPEPTAAKAASAAVATPNDRKPPPKGAPGKPKKRDLGY